MKIEHEFVFTFDNQLIMMIPENASPAIRYAKLDAIMCSHITYKKMEWYLKSIIEYNTNLKIIWTD